MNKQLPRFDALFAQRGFGAQRCITPAMVEQACAESDSVAELCALLRNYAVVPLFWTLVFVLVVIFVFAMFIL